MVTYSFYTDNFNGDSIAQADWERLEKRASEKLAMIQRIYTLTPVSDDSESMAICALADAVNYFETAAGGGLFTSSSIGSVSSSSGGVTVDTSKAAQDAEFLDCLRAYYDIYKGVRRRCYR